MDITRRLGTEISRPFAAVVAGGDFSPADLLILDKAGLVIAADSGLEYVYAFGRRAHLAIGDMDSCPQEVLEKAAGEGVPSTRYPAEKDSTDTELAVEEAIKQGYRSIVLLGGWGGTRPEHSLGNVGLVERCAVRGVDLVLLFPGGSMFGICANSGSLVRKVIGNIGDWVSLIPVSRKVLGVWLSGFKYPLKGAILQRGSTLGISNELSSEVGEVKIEEGSLLVVYTSR